MSLYCSHNLGIFFIELYLLFITIVIFYLLLLLLLLLSIPSVVKLIKIETGFDVRHQKV